MKNFIAGAVVLATALSANALEPAQGLDKPIPSPASLLLDKLKAVANSPRYYWAWTHTLVDPWLQQGDARHAVAKDGGYVPKALSDVELKFDYGKYSGGRRTVINYSDLAAIAGTWHSPEYYAANRASLTAAIKKQWREFGGIVVFSWHMDHPYCTNGFPKASYRFKSSGENRNVIRQILDGTGGPCGTGCIDGNSKRKPFANPREWYKASLGDVAAFFDGLADDETGRRIPVIMRYPHEMDGAWFWWGRTWCSPQEFRAFCRETADCLRKKCPGQILFAYTPGGKMWKDFGAEGDTENTFLACYPGDAYVDIIGMDDYSIGSVGDCGDESVEAAFAGVVRKLRLVTAFAKERGKVAALTETGGKKRRRDFWTFLHRVATAEGVGIAFVNTWSRHWGTIPLSPEEAENQRSFALRPEVIMEGPGNGFRPTPPAR